MRTVFFQVYIIFCKHRLFTETEVSMSFIDTMHEAPTLINNVVTEVEVTDPLSSLSQRFHTE